MKDRWNKIVVFKKLEEIINIDLIPTIDKNNIFDHVPKFYCNFRFIDKKSNRFKDIIVRCDKHESKDIHTFILNDNKYCLSFIKEVSEDKVSLNDKLKIAKVLTYDKKSNIVPYSKYTLLIPEELVLRFRVYFIARKLVNLFINSDQIIIDLVHL